MPPSTTTNFRPGPIRVSPDGYVQEDVFFSGTLEVANLTVLGTFTFGDAALDALILKGRLSTMTANGAAIDLGSTYTYGEGFELRYSVSNWTGIGSSFKGGYLRAENAVSGSGKDITGLELYGVANNVTTGAVTGLRSYAYIKGTSAKTVGPAYGVHGELSFDASSSTNTITTELAAGMLKITGGVCDTYTKIHGLILRSGDMDGASRTYGNAILIEDDAAMAGVITWTKGVSITSSCTTSISITGSATTAIDLATGTFGTGISLAGTLTTGILIGAATTGISITGATTNAVSVTGSATSAFVTGTGTFTNGLLIGGTVTTGVSIGAATTGINFTGAVTNAIVVGGTSTAIIRATGAATNLLSFDAVEGCVSAQSGGTATYSHKIAVNIDGVGTVYLPLAASFA